MFTRKHLETLLESRATPAISIFLPTHESGRPIRQDSIRFRNLLAEAEERLLDGGMRRPDAKELLKAAQQRLDDGQFWRHQSHGLAVFIAPGFHVEHRIPTEMPEQVTVGRHFQLRPLLPLLADDGQFLLLTGSAARTRLFEGSRFALVEREDLDLPQGVPEISEETDYENTLHSSPVARPRSAFSEGIPKSHNFGETPEEQRHAQFIRYMQRLNKALEQELATAGSDVPVVLAGHPEVQGQFRAYSNLEALMTEGLSENPDAASDEELHRKAYEVVRPLFAGTRRAALERFHALVGVADPLATTKPDEILRAARQGRVDKLYLTPDALLRGRYDEAADTLQMMGDANGDADELLNLCAIETMRTGGHVHVVPQEELRPGAIVAATLRFAA